MQALKEVNFKSPILFFKIVSDNKIATIDANTNIRILEQKNFTLSSGIKGQITHKDSRQRVVTMSSDLKYLISSNEDNRGSLLINLENKTRFAKFNRHQGELSLLAIDPLNRYVFSCGDDGKIFALDIKSGKLTFILPMHQDRVNDIAFSSDGEWCISVGYDKKTTIFNLTTMKTIHKLHLHSKPVMKATFIDASRAITIDKNAIAFIFNIYDGKIIKRLEGIHDDVTALYSSSKLLFVGTALGYVILYDLKTYKILSKQFIKIDSCITQLELNKETNTLFVTSSNGDLLSYNIYLGEEDLRSSLQKKDYKSIQAILNRNPLLLYTSAYIRFNHIWEESFQKAKDALEKGDQKRVDELFKHFNEIPSKRKIIQKLLEEYKDFQKFREVISSGKISLAYNFLNMHPEYKDSKTYQLLESQWKNKFLEAQKALSKPRGLEKANEILKPYKGITDKTIYIQSLLKEHLIYNQFKKSIIKEEFKIVFEYVKLHPFLKEFPEYQDILNYASSLQKKSINLIQKKEFNAAIKVLKILENFADFKEEALSTIETLRVKQTLLKAINNNNLQVAYDILDNNFHLHTTQEGKLLQEQWNKDVEEANALALHANINALNALLNKYFNIPSRYLSLSTLYAYCYNTELERAIQTKKSSLEIEKGIKKYVLLFGLNNQIIHFYTISKRYYKDINIDLKSLSCGSLSSWNPSMILTSLFH